MGGAGGATIIVEAPLQGHSQEGWPYQEKQGGAFPLTLPTPYTLHPAPCTLHPAPYTLHLAPDTLDSERCLPSALEPRILRQAQDLIAVLIYQLLGRFICSTNWYQMMVFNDW